MTMATFMGKWHGEPVLIEYGTCIVKRNTEKPLWWYNYEVAMSRDASEQACIEAIRILPNYGPPFAIANHFGIGEHKLDHGGWPTHVHHSLPVETFKKSSTPIIHGKLNEPEYAAHEAARDAWMKREHPEEYNKLDGLRRLIRSSQRPPSDDEQVEQGK